MRSNFNLQFLIGLLIGLLSPLFFLPIMLYFMGLADGYDFSVLWNQFISNNMNTSKYLSLALISNLIWFYFFLNREKILPNKRNNYGHAALCSIYDLYLFCTIMKKLFIIAGEPSGDLHASNLVKELLQKEPSLDIKGWGGELMSRQGVELKNHLENLSFMGFLEVVMNLRQIRKILSYVKGNYLSLGQILF